MGIDHVMAASEPDGKGASLEYDFELSSDMQQLSIAIGILPTQDVYPARGLRIGVQIDDQPLQIVGCSRRICGYLCRVHSSKPRCVQGIETIA